ncbi:MAG: hypothetical protein DMG78_32340 [Acidobacteria bacterium]|nr:MAG: hypothetical protein DMG78_32340 [Acidobacteriota bacterium]
MAAMSIYKVLGRTVRFGVSFRVCDSKDAGVGSCDQFLTELSLRDCSVYTQRAYALGLAHFFSWLHAAGGDPDHVTRQTVGKYITEFARGTKQGAVGARGTQKPRQPRTINHRLSVLASYFGYCIRRDTEDGRGPWKGRINPASGNPFTEELRHGMIGGDLPVRQRQRDGFRRRIPRTLPKVLEPTAVQKLIDSAGSYRDKAILTLLSRAGKRIGDWSPVAGRHGILGMALEDVDRVNLLYRKLFGIEWSAPHHPLFMFRMVWIKHCFQVVGVTPDSSRVFWRAAPLVGEAARIRHGWFGHKDRFQQQFMLPTVAVVVHIGEGGTYARHHRGKAYPLCVDHS